MRGGRAVEDLCAFWKLHVCGFCGIVCGTQVNFRWSVEGGLRTWVLGARDDAVVGVACPLPSALASGWCIVLVEQFWL